MNASQGVKSKSLAKFIAGQGGNGEGGCEELMIRISPGLEEKSHPTIGLPAGVKFDA